MDFRFHVLAALMLAVIASGCAREPRTQVMVVLDAGGEVRARATRVRVELRGGSALKALADEAATTETYAGDDVIWPRRMALVPSNDAADRVFEVRVAAEDNDGVFTQATVRSGYVEGETLVLLVYLADGCVPRGDCGKGRTCAIDDGVAVCGAAPFIEPDSLERYDPEDLPEPPDAAVNDTGMGGAGDADASDQDATPAAGELVLSLGVQVTDDEVVASGKATIDDDAVEGELSFGDGSDPVVVLGSFEDVKHTYARPGEYVVELRAMDEDDAPEVRMTTVSVEFIPTDTVYYAPLNGGDCSPDSTNGSEARKNYRGEPGTACFLRAGDPKVTPTDAVPMGPNVTLVGWIKKSTDWADTILLGRGSLPAIMTRGANVGVAIDQDGTIMRLEAPVTSGWHCVVGRLANTGTDTNLRLYVDSELADEQNVTGWVNAVDACPVVVGGGASGASECTFAGTPALVDTTIDELRIYNRALSELEIELLCSR